MNPDTAEIAPRVGPAGPAPVAQPGGPLDDTVPGGATEDPRAQDPAAREWPGARARRTVGAALDRITADPWRSAALRDSWRALWSSRLLVWAAGVGTVLAFGFGPARKAFNPPGVTRGFGWLGDLLAAPAARWDSAWYLVIARYGYRPDLGHFTRPAHRVLPALPAGLAGDLVAGQPAGAGRRAALAGRSRSRALRHPPPRGARVRLARRAPGWLCS